MMDPERVKQLIAEGLPCEGLHVQGDGQHFEALIVSSLFEGFGDDAVTSIGEFAPDMVTAVVLYDLIPLACSETYLDPNPAYRAFYHGKLQQPRIGTDPKLIA